MQLFVVAQAYLDAGFLEVITHRNFLFDEGNDFILFQAQERFLVHFQGFLQGVQFAGERFREAVLGQGFLHLVKKGAGR